MNVVCVGPEIPLSSKIAQLEQFLQVFDEKHAGQDMEEALNRVIDALHKSPLWSRESNDKPMDILLTYYLMLLNAPERNRISAKAAKTDLRFVSVIAEHVTGYPKPRSNVLINFLLSLDISQHPHAITMLALTVKFFATNKMVPDSRLGCESLLTWLDLLNSSPARAAEIYEVLLSLIEMYEKSGKEANAMKCRIHALSLKLLPQLKNQAVDVLLRSIADPYMFELNALLEYEQIRMLEGEIFYKIFTEFMHGNIDEFVNQWKIAYENGRLREAIERNDINITECMNKIKMIAFLKMCESCDLSRKTLEYDKIKELLTLGHDKEVEELVIRIVKAKLAHIMIDSANRRVVVSNAFSNVFDMAKWESMLNALSNRRTKITTGPL